MGEKPWALIREIREICAAGVRGQHIDTRRAEQLFKQHPTLYAHISDEERRKAQEEYRRAVGVLLDGEHRGMP